MDGRIAKLTARLSVRDFGVSANFEISFMVEFLGRGLIGGKLLALCKLGHAASAASTKDHRRRSVGSLTWTDILSIPQNQKN